MKGTFIQFINDKNVVMCDYKFKESKIFQVH